MFYVDLERLQENNTGVWIDPINSFIKKLPNEKYSTLKIVIKNCRVYLVYVNMKGVIATYFFIGISTKREGEYDFKSIQEIKDVLKIHDDFNSTKPSPVFCEVSNHLGVYVPQENYVCDGSGTEIALGSLYSTEDLVKKPEERLRIALRACDYHTIYCDGAIDIVECD